MNISLNAVAPETEVRFNAALTASEWESLLERQRDRESAAIAGGRAKYEAAVAEANRTGKAASTGAALTLMRQITQRLEAVLDEWLPKAHGNHKAKKWIAQVGTLDAAYITSRAVLNLMHIQPSVRHVCLTIADDIVSELQLRVFEKKAPGLFKYKMGSFVGSTPTHMARSLSASMKGAVCEECRKKGVSVERGESCRHLDVDALGLTITDENAIHLGMKLLDVFITATGMVEEQRSKVVKGAKRGKVTVREANLIVPGKARQEWLGNLTPLEWLAERNELLQTMFPPNQPMIVPPLRWGPEERGGYRFALRGRQSFVRGLPKRHRKEVEKNVPAVVYEAVNRMQETPWAINRRVLNVMREVIGLGGDRAGIVATQPIKPPAKPVKEWETDEDRKADPEWRAWRKAASRAHDAEYRRGLKARELHRVVDAAAGVVDEAAIWFPCTVDFRGRVYPLTSEALSPQGDDKQKGLLLFAQGKPLGSEGAAWLALHGANTLGKWDGQKLSHLTLQERVDVIQGLTLRIARIADPKVGPLVEDFWMDADEPWQFLAFCFEWAGFYQLWRQGRGEEYVCSLPVAVDGTCNGLQLFSGLFLDEVGAASVNVSPSERPQDVYQRLADIALTQVELDAAEDDLANLWLTSGLISRSLTKRPTMTFGYGSGQFGMKGQLMEWMGDADNAALCRSHFRLPGEDGELRDVRGPACAYMAKVIWQSLPMVVVKAFEGMDWIRKSAREVAKAGGPVRWTAPGTGFPVVQAKREYYKEEVKQVKTTLCGRITFPTVYKATDEVDTRKQATGAAPNVIHSIDAAMLQLTVVECARMNDDMGFAMVHDSYGTLPADMGLMAQTLREVFVRLFTERDVAADLAAEWLAQAPEGDFPAIPARGNLDISDVRNSDYFFC